MEPTPNLDMGAVGLVLGRFASGLKQPLYWQETHTPAEARSRGAEWMPYNEGGAQSDPIQKRLGT